MVSLTPFVTSFLLGLLAIIYYLSMRAKNISKKAPPGSMGWPLVGETISFLAPHKSNAVGAFIESRIIRYGKVFRSHLFGQPTVVSCNLDLNMFILQNEEKLFLVNYPKAMHGILGKLSLLIVSGEVHKKLRSVVVGFLNATKSNPAALRYIEKLSVEMLDSWKREHQVDFCKEAKMFAFSITVKPLLSLTSEEAGSKKILQDFLTFMEGFVSLPVYLPGTSYTNAVKARGRLCSKMREIIKQRRDPNGEKKMDCESDFLDVLLSKESLNDEEIVSVLLDILLGGYETTATLMALILYFLANCPAVLDELREEHQRIAREKLASGDEKLCLEDHEKMDFTSKVISETLRCGNVVKFVHRRALQDVEYKGYVIPAGWQVLPIFTGTHLDSSLHEKPFEFNPWRWTVEARSKKVTTPFGGGIRMCPGAALALVEIAVFLHHLVLRYSWKLKGNDCPLAHPYVEFVNGLPLEIQPLNKI